MLEDVGSITASSLVVTLCLGLLLLTLPRRYALAPILIGASYLTLGQNLSHKRSALSFNQDSDSVWFGQALGQEGNIQRQTQCH
jgi:hypothetical protein